MHDWRERVKVSQTQNPKKKELLSACEISSKNEPNDDTASKMNEGVYERLRAGTITLLQKQSIKWCALFALLIVFTATIWNLIPKFYQLPSTDMEVVEPSSAILSVAPGEWSNVKLVVYMTSHLPDYHVDFLPCWKDAIERFEIFKYADLLLYTAASLTHEQLQFLPFRNVTIKNYTNSGYQEGAVQAMVDPFLEPVSWFDGYDWVVRVNMDVLIREDTWLMHTMLNTSVDAIVHECSSSRRYTTSPTLHSDFFAFRPKAFDRERLLHANRENAESHFTDIVRHIYDSGRFAYVKGGKNENEDVCRIAGVDSPVLHVHELSNFCPYYYNVTKYGVYL